MLSMGNNNIPSNVKAFGPVTCENNQLVFQFDAPRQGFFIVLPYPIVTVEEAVQLNQYVAYGICNGTIYKSYYDRDGPVDNKEYKYRSYVINPNGDYGSWGSSIIYIFNGNTLTVKTKSLVNGRTYYLLTIQTLAEFS